MSIFEENDGQFHINKGNCVIEGTEFRGGKGAYWTHSDGRPYHTFRTQTVLADGDDIVFRKCVFENTAGPGDVNGQGIALYLDGNNIVVEDSVIIGNQDTLFLAPLPPKEYEKDGFLGPKQFSARTMRSFLFKGCKIYGSIDFVFGGAAAVFEKCDFISVAPGWIFAPCTPEGEKSGFVARDCRFLYEGDVGKGSCCIARPWREYARVRLENCFLDEHISPSGWDDWGKISAHDTVCFEEYDSYGPGAVPDERPEWVTVSLLSGLV